MHRQPPPDRSNGCAIAQNPAARLVRANYLSIKNGVALKPCRLRYNERVALRPIRSVHGVEPHPPVLNVDLQSIAVMLQLMRPAWAAGGLLGDERLTGMNEGGRCIDWPAAGTIRTRQHTAVPLLLRAQLVGLLYHRLDFLTDLGVWVNVLNSVHQCGPFGTQLFCQFVRL